jgi:peptidylprolyl isomerase
MSSVLTSRIIAALAALVVLTAACGGDDASSTTVEAPPPTTEGVEVSVPPDDQTSDERVVQTGDNVSVHYTGTLDDGSVFDSSIGGATLDFTAGAGQMIAGFDAAVMGMEVGESKTFRLSPAEAYGERSDDLLVEVGRDQVPAELAPGQELVDGVGNRVVVVEVRDDVVVIDQNHPLAGEFLTFEIELVSIN